MSASPILNKGKFFEGMNFLQQNVAYDSSGNAIFMGYAAPGTANSTAAWLIVRNTYDGSNMTESRFADNSVNFDKIWDNRTHYIYS